MDRISEVRLLDEQRIATAIEFTRFPVSKNETEINEEGSLLRAADLIGQLGDPRYLYKANALYYEFEEIGMNRQLGYELTSRYRRFISSVLLEQRFAACSIRNPISKRNRKRSAVDSDSIQQCLSRRAGNRPSTTECCARTTASCRKIMS